MFIRNLSKLALFAIGFILTGCSGGILDPKGQVGVDEKNLIIISTILMLLVVVPVIVLTLYFAWKYRASRDFEIYAPKWAHSTKIEAVVWAIPIVIVVVLGVITWQSTQELDPYKPLEGKGKHMTVEVVSLDWKWLFIYPELGIASVNELAFPTGVPVKYKITSESVMNSFFIPQLGSQIYSMAGMETQIHLIADHPGTYDGYSANYSGEGFTGMQFKAIATPTQADFDAWVEKVRQQGGDLTKAQYSKLAERSENNPVEYFGHVDKGLFHSIVMKYMQDYGEMDYYSKPEDSAHMDHKDHMQHKKHMQMGAGE
ncbi:ubiquinol oxidase subunit II [Neptunicella marina]|uniref:Ubiquinol oxidase subunit 2 n=1 Tax=Neptunicella marina TaxID=2125989 RepID=A0A8J6M580_9ALTE|nr:ubiquinol oxidase subunit II [Neptunicella marina]MBC3766356.1 ubiquinol oxidase subunit II [Neptunicella marina]